MEAKDLDMPVVHGHEESIRLLPRPSASSAVNVIAYSEVVNKIIEVIRFHDGMRGCARLENGKCSESFDVEQGLRPVCMLLSLLFNI